MFSDELEKISWEETTKAIYSKTDADVRRALGKKEHLDVNDFMALISPAATPYLEVMARLSQKYTMERFGKTISMFVPLYITNSCTNSCVYCGFHISNPMKRTILTEEEIINEYKAIKLFNYKSDNFLEAIKQCRDSFIVIDNADCLINDDVRRFINFELSNQYMLFLRNCDGLNVSDRSFKVLKFDNNRITLEEEL